MDTLLAQNAQPEALHDQIEALTLSQERARMSREIHDGLGQYLQAAGLLAAILAEEDTADPRRIRLLHAIEAVQREVRRAITTLTDNPHQSLEDMLGEPLLDARMIHHLRTSRQIVGTTRHLPFAVRHALLRITQEALTNIVKYATARSVQVTLDYTDLQAVRLTIADDGQGFSGHTPPSGHGHGLRNMRERAEALGGTLTVTSTEQGVTVWTTIPTPACSISASTVAQPEECLSESEGQP